MGLLTQLALFLGLVGILLRGERQRAFEDGLEVVLLDRQRPRGQLGDAGVAGARAGATACACPPREVS